MDFQEQTPEPAARISTGPMARPINLGISDNEVYSDLIYEVYLTPSCDDNLGERCEMNAGSMLTLAVCPAIPENSSCAALAW